MPARQGWKRRRRRLLTEHHGQGTVRQGRPLAWQARAAASAQAGRSARRQAPPARGAPALPAFLHRSEQWRTSSQSRLHFLRQVKGSLQTAQIFAGRSDFLRIFGMGQPCGGGRFPSAVRHGPASSAAQADPGRNMSAAGPGGKAPLPPASVGCGGHPAQRRDRLQPVPLASPRIPDGPRCGRFGISGAKP